MGSTPVARMAPVTATVNPGRPVHLTGGPRPSTINVRVPSADAPPAKGEPRSSFRAPPKRNDDPEEVAAHQRAQEALARKQAELNVQYEPVEKVGTFTYPALKNGVDLPKTLDPSKKEAYLSESDFQMVFNMNKTQFTKLSAWRQRQLKMNAGLF